MVLLLLISTDSKFITIIVDSINIISDSQCIRMGKDCYSPPSCTFIAIYQGYLDCLSKRTHLEQNEYIRLN